MASMTFAGSARATPTHVACIGDSITYGVGASSPSKDWVSDLATLLGSSVTVGNYGVSGTTMLMQSNMSYWSTGDLAMVETFVMNAGANASVAVIIMLGTNDSKDNPSGVDNWNSTAPARYAADYGSMIDDLLALTPKPQVFLALPPPAFANTYDIDGTVIANQIIPIVAGIAGDRQPPLIDVHSALAGMSSFFPDGVHPNDMGHMVIATTMQKGLLSPKIPPPPGDGGVLDAAAPSDAGAPGEAGTPDDSGSPSDAAAPADASIAGDASTAYDGAAIPDAGMSAEGGAGAVAPGAGSGCGCTAAGRDQASGPASWLVAILGALGLRRRVSAMRSR